MIVKPLLTISVRELFTFTKPAQVKRTRDSEYKNIIILDYLG
jgi:hypothetical protein